MKRRQHGGFVNAIGDFFNKTKDKITGSSPESPDDKSSSVSKDTDNVLEHGSKDDEPEPPVSSGGRRRKRTQRRMKGGKSQLAMNAAPFHGSKTAGPQTMSGGRRSKKHHRRSSKHRASKHRSSHTRRRHSKRHHSKRH